MPKLITEELLELHDKYHGDFGLLDEHWALEKDRVRFNDEQLRLIAEYEDKLHLLKVESLSQDLREKALKRILEIEEQTEDSVISAFRERIAYVGPANLPPTLHQRLAQRERPKGFAVMRQRWSKLLFLHWRVDPDLLCPLLPKGLHLDLHDGEAWLGIVPFYMDRIRPTGLPPVPGLSWFLELNVRTYVYDDSGVPGVWFFSLDCNQALAVEIARRKFHLPYEHAEMEASRTDDTIQYECRRKDQSEIASYTYRPTGPAKLAEPGSLDFFLAERYLLYSASPDGSLYTGRVHHEPYQLAPAECAKWSSLPAEWDSILLPNTPADSALYVEHVDVSVFSLKRH